MATARVSASSNFYDSGNSALGRTLIYGNTLTVGSTLIVCGATYNVGITLTVSDSVNGAYTQVGTYSIGSDTNGRVSIWIFKNNTTSTNPTVTVTPSATAYVSFAVDQYTGLGANPTVHATAASTYGAQDPVTTGTVTASSGDLVIAALGDEATTVASSVNSPFLMSQSFNSGNEGLAVAYHLSASGNESCTFDMASASTGETLIASITPEGGGGGGRTAKNTRAWELGMERGVNLWGEL